MTFDHRNLIVVGTAAIVGLVACEKKENTDQTQTSGATTSTVNLGAGMDPNDTTIDRITETRCKHEVTCNNVGSGKKWADEAACRRETRQPPS